MYFSQPSKDDLNVAISSNIDASASNVLRLLTAQQQGSDIYSQAFCVCYLNCPLYIIVKMRKFADKIFASIYITEKNFAKEMFAN